MQRQALAWKVVLLKKSELEKQVNIFYWIVLSIYDVGGNIFFLFLKVKKLINRLFKFVI